MTTARKKTARYFHHHKTNIPPSPRDSASPSHTPTPTRPILSDDASNPIQGPATGVSKLACVSGSILSFKVGRSAMRPLYRTTRMALRARAHLHMILHAHDSVKVNAYIFSLIKVDRFLFIFSNVDPTTPHSSQTKLKKYTFQRLRFQIRDLGLVVSTSSSLFAATKHSIESIFPHQRLASSIWSCEISWF